MIKIENLNFKFDGDIIFKNANIEIPKGKITVILGANGAGKSTLLKIVTKNLKSDCAVQNTFKNMFYLPQNPYYPNGITVFDYLSFTFFKNGWKWFLNDSEKEKVYNVLEMLEMLDKKDLNLENLSAGEFQKANIGLGLLSSAELFLLDEPASNMDLINEIKVFDTLRKLLYDGVTSVLIMHDINLAANFGDYFIGINKPHSGSSLNNNGKNTDGAVIQAEKDKFFTKENLREIYGIDFEILKTNGKFYIQIVN